MASFPAAGQLDRQSGAILKTPLQATECTRVPLAFEVAGGAGKSPSQAACCQVLPASVRICKV